jgi:hypothetical protein
MEKLFIAVTFALLAAAAATMVRIVRDVFPHLSEQHQECFLRWTNWNHSFVGGYISRAIHSAWDEHTKMFPNSRKRALFAVFLVAMALSVIPLVVASR